MERLETIKTKILSLIGLLAMTAIAVSCGPRYGADSLSPQAMKAKGFTGLVKHNPNGTQSAVLDTRVSTAFEATKQELVEDWESMGIRTASEELSRSIKEVTIKKQSEEFLKEGFELVVNLEQPEQNRTLLFRNLKMKDNKLQASKPTEGDPYELSAQCENKKCSEIHFSLVHFEQSSKKVIAKSGFIYRFTEVKVQVSKPHNKDNVENKNLRNLYRDYEQEQTVKAEEVVVAAGRSTTHLDLGNGVSMDFDNDETIESTGQVRVKGQGRIQSELIGNSGISNGKGANNLIVMEDKSGERVYIEVKRSQKKQQVPQGLTDLEARVQNYFIKPNLSDPFQRQVVEHMEMYRDVDVIQQSAQRFAQTRRGGFQSFFDNVKNDLPSLKKVIEGEGAPSTILYVTVVESSYFTKFQRDTLGADCEVGLWQFMKNTAIGKGLSAFNVQGHQANKCHNKNVNYVVNPNDERQYIYPATAGAAKKFRGLFERFSWDPPLAYLAYNAGEKGALRKIGKDNSNVAAVVEKNSNIALRVAEDLQYTYLDLLNNNVTGIDYVNKSLSAYFIGANPEQYGFERNRKGRSIPKEDLCSPQWIQRGHELCRAI